MSDSDAQLIVHVGGIITGMTGNASFPTPSPTLAAVTAALNAFTTAVNDAIAKRWRRVV